MRHRTGDLWGETDDLLRLGSLQSALGRKSSAIEFFLEAEKLIGQMPKGSSDNLFKSVTTLAAVGGLMKKVDMKEADDFYKRSKPVLDRDPIGVFRSQAAADMGDVAAALGKGGEARELYRQALQSMRKSGLPLPLAGILQQAAAGLLSLGEEKECLDLLQEAGGIYRQAGVPSGEAGVLLAVGRAHKRAGHWEDSLAPLEQCAKMAEDTGLTETAMNARRELGESLWRGGRSREAVPQYRAAVRALETLYGETRGLSEEERGSFLSGRNRVYREFLELLLELHGREPGAGHDREAFTVAEKGKSRTFLELMAKAGARASFAGDDEFKDLMEREKGLSEVLGVLRQRLGVELGKPSQERSTEAVESLKGEIQKAEASRAELERVVEERYPRYADLKRPKPLTVEELQEVLGEDEAVVSYAMGSLSLAAFVVTKSGFALLSLPLSEEELTGLVQRYRRGVGGVRELADLERFDLKAGEALYTKVFAPLETLVADKPMLYISADGALYTVPFEGLPWEVNEKAFRDARREGRQGRRPYLCEYASARYLVERCTIGYLPSASVLRSMRRYPKAGGGKWDMPLVAFADPVFGVEGEKVPGGPGAGGGVSGETALSLEAVTRAAGVGGLNRLEESAEEARAVAGALGGGEVFLREEATEERVYRTALNRARFILFSTHGLLGGEFSGVAEPSLVLTLVGNPPGRDGFLTMNEILGLDLTAESVLLSACNTAGQGDAAGRGEGFAGLTRSFMYAGGRSLLVTHWEVESEAARDLIVSIFKHLGGAHAEGSEAAREDRHTPERARARETKNSPPEDRGGLAEALRDAKLAMLRGVRDLPDGQRLSLSHPFFWAPFVLVGEGR